MKSRKKNLRQVYVWELPVRFYHWLNALCILVLCVTGYIIAKPPAILSQTEANFTYWFGTMRFVHFVTAFVFVFNVIFRLYWAFVGNKYATWNNYLPLRIAQWKEFWQVIKTDVLMIDNERERIIGHNTVASLSYFVLFLGTLLVIFTGFGLYAQTSTSAVFQMFTWIVPMLGGEMDVRIIHHLLMWFFILFSIIHIYIVLYHDYIARHAYVSAMIGGWKIIHEDVAAEEEEAERKAQRA